MPLVRNPILPGFNADPSIVRVGSDYYIATSTFEWFPGVQIHHSTDLANWTLVARPLSRAAQLDMRGDPDSCGVWAPCLTHDGDRFWLVYTDVKRKDGAFKDTHNYIVHAPAITGPWSDPVYANSSGFDPSLFHDRDTGRKWFVNMLADHRRRRGRTSFSGIVLQEFDPVRGALVGPRKNIYRGTDLALTEAPHLYKRRGRYYLLVAEGGTGYDHAVTMARSVAGADIWGPYETHPDQYILTAKDHPLAALQRAGHGDLVGGVDGDDGDSDGQAAYLVHLTGRPTTQQRRCVLGRETAIQRAHWRADGWLYVDQGPVPSLWVDVPGTRDDAVATSAYWQPRVYLFRDAAADYRATNGAAARLLHPDFQWLRTPAPERLFRIDTDAGHLVLTGREAPGSWFEQALVARRQTHFSFDAETTLVGYAPEDERQFAGLAVYYCRYNYFYLTVTADGDTHQAASSSSSSSAPGPRELLIQASEATFPDGNITLPLPPPVLLPPTGDVHLKVTVRGKDLQFWYALGGDTDADADAAADKTSDTVWTRVGPVYDASLVSDECGGHKEHGSFTGSFVGVAASDLNGLAKEARFSRFVYRPEHDRTDRYDV